MIDPIKLTQWNLDGRSIDYSTATAKLPYTTVVLNDQPWWYCRFNNSSGSSPDIGVPNPGPVNHPASFPNGASYSQAAMTGDGATSIKLTSGSDQYAITSELSHTGVPQTFETLLRGSNPATNHDEIISLYRNNGTILWIFGGGARNVGAAIAGGGVTLASVSWNNTNIMGDGNVHQLTMAITAGSGGDANLELFIDGVTYSSKTLTSGQAFQCDLFLVGTDNQGNYSDWTFQEPHVYAFNLNGTGPLRHWNAVPVP